jgi:HD-GYP domain-containing protein (c-di-GMP phosphodiesterase class II)
MRYISVSRIEEGMVLGQDIFDLKGFLLLRHGQKLYGNYIERLKNMGVIGVYIADESTQDIEINPVIDDAKKMAAVNNVKNLFMSASRGTALSLKLMDDAVNSVQDMVESIFFCKDPVYDVREFKVSADYNFYHAVNVATISMIMGVGLQMSKPDLKLLGMCGAFCNIGLTAIKSSVLEKTEVLTPSERTDIQRHSLIGYSILRDKYNVNAKVQQGALHHHERWNGSGYPSGLKGKDIGLFGRITAIADVYDALVSKRPYRQAYAPFEAVEYIMGNSGILFDPELVKTFTRKVAAYPIGTSVLLSDGSTGIVKKNHYDCSLRPVVKIIDEKHGVRIIDLKDDKGALNLTISAQND